MNKKKLLSILMAVLVMVTMSFSSVYALEEMDTPADEPVVTDDATDNGDAIVGEDEGQPADGEEVITEDPEEVGLAPIEKPETVSGYKAIMVKWIPNGGANAVYVIEREGNGADWTEIAKVPAGATDENGYMSYEDNSGLVKETDFSYRIYVQGAKDETMSDVATDQYVRTAHVNITTKVKKTLSCHCSGHKAVTISVKAGTNISTTGYGSGKYHFYQTVNGVEHTFYLMRVAAKNQKTDYTKDWDYSREEAEFFVKGRFGCGATDKAHMVWVNEYCQHLYWFDKKYDEDTDTYKWACTDDWKISTGKASTPSPTGVKAVVKKVSKRHGIKYWSCYSSYNALHGVKSNWATKLGTPQSGGCIRNATSTSAYKIYKNLLKGQRVYVY